MVLSASWQFIRYLIRKLYIFQSSIFICWEFASVWPQQFRAARDLPGGIFGISCVRNCGINSAVEPRNYLRAAIYVPNLNDFDVMAQIKEEVGSWESDRDGMERFDAGRLAWLRFFSGFCFGIF